MALAQMKKVNDLPLNYANKQVYLRQIISHKNQSTKENKKRIINSQKRYWSLKEVIKFTKLRLETVYNLLLTLSYLQVQNLVSLKTLQKYSKILPKAVEISI